MSYIDTYELATGGQNLSNTFTLASNGILVDIYITDLPPEPTPDIPSRRKPGGSPEEEKKKKDRKEVTVVVTIDGKRYKETVIVEDRPNLSVKNVKVDILEGNVTPKIKITILG